MKKFIGGYLLGTVVTTAFVVGLAYGVKKTMIEPIEEKQAFADDKRRQAARKSHAR